MSVLLKRHQKLESVTLQPDTGIDGQGKPTYANPGTTHLVAVERAQEVVRLGTGEEVKIVATVWFEGGATALPSTNDRLVLSDLTGIVVMRDAHHDLQSGQLDHVEVKIKQE